MVRLWPFRRSRDRAVFAYRDPAGRRRYADPAEVRASLSRHLPAWADRVADLRNNSKPVPRGAITPPPEWAAERQRLADAAADDLTAAVSAAFGADPFDPATGGGWTRNERLALLSDFLDYLGDLLERHRPFVSPPPATA